MAKARTIEVISVLAWREWARFIRQPHRVIGALLQPLIFWVLLGLGFQGSFQLQTIARSVPSTASSAISSDSASSPSPQDVAQGGGDAVSYGEFFFPGVLAMILLFTAIFATISIIEDRAEGFLQGVLVSPAPRWAMVVGKVAGGTGLALMQAGLFACLGCWWLQTWPGVWGTLQLILFCGLVAASLNALGFVMAWQLDSAQGFHALMSVFLFPMWVLSGAAFPANSPVLRSVVQWNPLSYGVAGIRQLWYAGLSAAERGQVLPAGEPGLLTCWLVSGGFCLVMLLWSVAITQRRTLGDMR